MRRDSMERSMKDKVADFALLVIPLGLALGLLISWFDGTLAYIAR